MLEDIARELRQFASDRDWEQFHTPKNLSIALNIETAELMEIFQWLTPEESQSLSVEQLERVREEVGDVAIYLIRLCDLLNIDILSCAQDKIEVNAKKYPADKVRGSALKYNQHEDGLGDA